MNEPVIWSNADDPSSPRFGDVYRSRSGALAQAQSVFLGGCDLPDAWRKQARYAVLETGFGLGLNFLATWAAWRADACRSDFLHYTAIEAYPVAAADLQRSVMSLTGEGADALRSLADALTPYWSLLRPGLQTWALDEERVQLTLAVGEVAPMLAALNEPVDAVYLDGFSPALNPAMWSENVLSGVAQRCRPGARLATWCVAGAVRARLQALGFSVRRPAGLPPKRHRLEAVYNPADKPHGL